MKIKASLQGRQAMLSSLQKNVDSKLATMEKYMQLATIEGQAEAKKRARVDTGRMRSSIMQRVFKRSKYRIVGQFHTNVRYAKHLEYGTKYMRAYPFLRPAAKIAKQKFRERMKKLDGTK